jgi:non-specific serine/threonine protein kinase/serine/threonine-protein kinase
MVPGKLALDDGETCFGGIPVRALAMRERSIFMEALDFDEPCDRSAYILRACGGDDRLRARVEALLRRHQSEDERMLDRVAPVLPSVTEDIPRPLEEPGTSIGPYKLLEPIGEGGMGVVYMAEQTMPVRRKVALKIIKPGMDTRQVIARFEAERQALALMDHPNIARVLDAGATESGRPYFVMELVKGLPITDYCDRNRLPIDDRLKVFAQVCQAVQHAHQKGIIHRDIKPSNVLVTMIDGAAVPKVIDFGVAKATGQQLTEKTLFTGFAQLIGTPLYMSPEQVEFSGVDVDTRSDIYSLGVLLYELLTGTTPFDQETLRNAAYDEIRRIIREQEPPRPSTRINTLEATATPISTNRRSDLRSLGKMMRGEVDWIVMKTLEKDRSRRYQTANSLAADLNRHLSHEPVEAGPPSGWYRLGKAARRNRVALATAAVMASTLLAGTAVSVRQAIRARQAEGLAQTRLGDVTKERNVANLARKEADRRATEAQEVVDFLINDMIGAAAPSKTQGKLTTVDQVLAQADQNIANRFVDRPLIEASIRHALSQAYEELGEFSKAERHATRAVELRLARLGPDHAETIAAQNALGWALVRQNKYKESRELMAQTLRIARELLGPEHTETLQAMHILAEALLKLGKHGEARALQEQLLAMSSQVLGPEHQTTLETMSNLATIWQEVGEFEQAKQLYQQVLELGLRAQPNHPNTLITMSNFADLYDNLAHVDQAIDMRRRILEKRERILGLSHPFTRQSIEAYFDSARRNPARWEEARTVLAATLDRSHRELGTESETAQSLTRRLAIVLGLLGRTDEAVALIDGLPENRQSLDAREELARFFYSHDWRDAALHQFQRVEALRPSLVPADDPFGLAIRTRLALVLREHGRFAEAKTLLEKTVAEALPFRSKPEREDCWPSQYRGIAQLLLGRWPGIAPGVSPAALPPSSFTIDAPFRRVSPIADGQIAPGEYGPGIEVTFDGDTNPGRLWTWGKSPSKTADDLSLRIHAAYTDRALFVAVEVRDQFVEIGQLKASIPGMNDNVQLFLNGDHVANDMMPIFRADRLGNREGFQLLADAAGHQLTQSVDFTKSDWKVGTSRISDGYIVEFEIPLVLIDTRDGPEFVPATSGSEIPFNLGLNDFDTPNNQNMDYAIFWAENRDLAPFMGGEDFWTASLRLVPEPTSIPGPSVSR